MSESKISPIKTDARQAGFSLIELLVVAVVLGVLFTAFARLYLASIKSNSRANERSESLNRLSVLTDMLQTDFGSPVNLLRASVLPATGTFPATFRPHPDFQIFSGGFARLSRTTNDPLTSAQILKSGEGRVSFDLNYNTTATLGWHTVGAAYGTGGNTIRIERGSEFSVFAQNGTIVFRGELRDEPERLSAAVERLPALGCRVAFYQIADAETRLLYRLEQECPSYPLEMVADVQDVGASIQEVEMSGTFYPRPDANGSQNPIAPLPNVGTTQIGKPVFINPENGDLVSFRSENTSDKAYLNENATFAANETRTVRTTVPQRNTVKPDDYVFIVDYTAARSIVCLVTNVQLDAAGNQLLTLSPPYGTSNAAWGLFYTPSSQYSGIVFPPGSEVVHLAPPVLYRYVAAEKLLVRREGKAPLWETVSPGVSRFTANINGDALDIEAVVNTEGIETDATAPAQTTRLSISLR